MKSEEIASSLRVLELPIKGTCEPDISLVRQQAELGREYLVPVDYTNTYSTCGDERKRIGLLSGEEIVMSRPSVWGGSDVYALGIAELTGVFSDDDARNGEDRLRAVKQTINDRNVKSGGHVGCAANAKFNTWMTTIAQNTGAVIPYAQQELGTDYDDETMKAVIAYADKVVTSGRYADWNEDVLLNVLGDEADQAIEVLADVPHEALIIERNRVPNMTINQSVLYDQSVVGKGNFELDDCYAELIEGIITSGPDATKKMKLARHAREAITAAVAEAVPNQDLYEAIIE